jgi:hypothetical protein
MIIANPMQNLKKYDLFAILGSGTYVVGSFGLLAAALMQGQTATSARESLDYLCGIVEKHWPIAVVSLFLAFLTGNILRAFPVSLVDNLTAEWFTWFERLRRGVAERSKFHQALLRDKFPYGPMLEFELNALKASHATDYTIPERDNLHTLFNFWKAELCRASGCAFEYTQELEGRVRLFATMFWAALFGGVAGLVGLFACALSWVHYGWGWPLALMTGISAGICFVFGSQLRRVRGQEVDNVFIAYISLRMEMSRQRELTASGKTGVGTPKTQVTAEFSKIASMPNP